MNISRTTLAILLSTWFFAQCGSDENTCDDECDSSIGEECILGECRCVLWEIRTVTFQLYEAGYSGLSLPECQSAITAGFEAWNDCACSDLEVVLGGTTTETQGSHDSENPENSLNLIIFHENEWQHDADAFLMLIIDTEGPGKPYGADIEFNAVDFTFDRGSIEQNIYDAISRVLRVESCSDMCTKYPTGEPASCGS